MMGQFFYQEMPQFRFLLKANSAFSSVLGAPAAPAEDLLLILKVFAILEISSVY